MGVRARAVACDWRPHVVRRTGESACEFAVVLFWIGRRLRLPMPATVLPTLAVLGAYLAVVQDRPAILRAALMAALDLVARPLFRRIGLLHTIALAALILLLWRPSSLLDSSFELSVVAAAVIAGLALPWMDRTSAPYFAGLAHLVAVSPQFAVFSVGVANPFGHPAESIVDRYRRAGVRLFRTDKDGAVTAMTDGDTLSVHSFAESRSQAFRTP